MLTIRELCEKYHYLTKSLVYHWVEGKELPHYRLGGKGKRGRVFIDEADFLAFIAKKKVEAGEGDALVPLKHLRG